MSRFSKTRGVGKRILQASVGLLVIVVSLNQSVASGIVFDFNLPASNASESLNALAEKTSHSLFYQTGEVSSVNVKALRGFYSLPDALIHLLQGTRLNAVVTEKGVIVVSMASDTQLDNSVERDQMNTKKSLLAATVAFFAGVGSTQGVLAQDVAKNEKSEFMLEEIVVTAQKREQSLQDVPISISVLGGDAMDKSRADGIAEELNMVPGVNLFGGDQNGGYKASVRGVTSSGLLFNGSSTVAYYLDETPFGFIRSSPLPDASAYDLERVEVLRGPQGTLYGASALNGVIRILTKDANLEESEFKVRLSGGTTEGGGNNYRGDLAVNIPIIEGKVAARVVLGHNDLSGWIDKPDIDKANSAELSNARFKINAEPTDALSLELSAWLSRSDWDAPSYANDDGVSTTITPDPLGTDYDVYAFNLEYDFGPVSLISATSYMDYEAFNNLDIFNLDVLYSQFDTSLFSQEVRLNSQTDSDWQWSAGAFYRSVEDKVFQTLPEFLVAPIGFTDESESYAVFGEVSRSLADGKYELAAGLRYFKDEVSNQEDIQHSGDPDIPLIFKEEDYSTVSPRLVFTWHANDDLNIYTSYSEGFRSGFPQIPEINDAGFPDLKEDTLINYEIGAKGNSSDGRVIYDVALYYMDWQDVQQNLSVGLFIAPLNGESASGLGLDLGLQFSPTDNFRWGLGFSWNDLTMDADVPALVTPGNLFDSGERLSESPEYTASIDAEYFFTMDSKGLEGRVFGSANYNSELTSVGFVGGSVVKSTGDEIFNSRLGLAISGQGNWETTLYVDNVTNEDGATRVNIFDPTLKKSRVRPRTVGLQVEFSF